MKNSISLGSITGDFLFAENSSMSIPPNRTVTNDPSLPPYRQQQQQATYSYQPPPQQQAPSSNVKNSFLKSHFF